MSRIYRGDRTIDGLDVTVDGSPLPPCAPKLSRNGFEWGYEGPEPRQLAYALLADHWGDEARALRHAPALMQRLVANFGNEWEVSGADIDAALATIAPADAAR